MDSPLVSIIVPIYNVEKYLDRCITSIVNQTYTNLEIILVDDGSPDNCPQMCDEWAKRDSRIKVIHKQNAGQGFARNDGLKMMSGDYLLFVDSDDYIHPETIEKTLILAQKDLSDVVMFGRCNVWADGKCIPLKMIPPKSLFEGEELLNDILPGLFTYKIGVGISVWGKLFRSKIFFDYNLNFKSEREVLSEDACLILSVFSIAKKVSVLSENFYYYFKNDTSFSRTYKKNHQQLNDNFLLSASQISQTYNYPVIVLQHIQCRYHTYTISGLKQIIQSDLSKQEKKKAVYDILKEQTFRQTLKWNVIKNERFLSRVLFLTAKLKLYPLCYLMIQYKAKK